MNTSPIAIDASFELAIKTLSATPVVTHGCCNFEASRVLSKLVLASLGFAQRSLHLNYPKKSTNRLLLLI
jgi:hypothetical protein